MTLDDVRAEIAGHLEDIKPLFVPGVRLTILCRHPNHPGGERDILLTDDDLPAAIGAIQRLRLQADDTADAT